MKFGRPLAIIVHYTVQFNLEFCKSSVSDMGPNTILNIFEIKKKYHKTSCTIQSEIIKISNIQSL